MSGASLPAGFEALTPFTAWALATETQRNQARVRARFEDITAFADAILPMVPQITAYLDAKAETGGHDEVDLKLFHMLLSLAEVAPAIESYNPQATVVDGYDSARFTAVENHRLRPAL